MAQITVAIRKAHRLVADLVPDDVMKQIPQEELLDRILHAEDLGARSRAAADPTLRKGYSSLARAVLRAQPRAVTERQANDLIAKAAGVGNTRQADALRAEAQRLQELHPPAPRRGESVAVAKAQAGDDALMICYDEAGVPFGVCKPDAVQPVTSPAGIAKAGKVQRQQAPVTSPALSTAVALLTRRRMAPDVSRDDVIGGQPPGRVLEAMEVVTDVCLELLSPADKGAGVLEGLGLLAARGHPAAGLTTPEPSRRGRSDGR